MPRSRPSYADVVSTLALVLALVGGGAAFAAVAKNSVGSAQIKNGAVKGKDVKSDALTSKQIRDATLTNAMVVAGPPAANRLLTAAPSTVAAVTLTAPSAGVVLLLAEAEFCAAEADAFVEVQVREGAVTRFAGEWDPGEPDDACDQTQSSSVVVPVSAGTHTYDLVLSESTPAGFSEVFQARLTAVFAARGTATPTGG
jgi:hypothetical protein